MTEPMTALAEAVRTVRQIPRSEAKYALGLAGGVLLALWCWRRLSHDTQDVARNVWHAGRGLLPGMD